METVLEKTQSVVLHNISWSAYKQMADSLQEYSPAHFTFDGGSLEIMVLSMRHESLKKILGMLFERLSECLEIEIFPVGSTTFRREDLERGFEPDECYYIENSELMRQRESVDLSFDPPPDLSLEIDVKHSSLNRMGIFASVGIPEVWRYDGEKLEIYLLHGDEYHISDHSTALPNAASGELSTIARFGQSNPRSEFLRQIEAYADRLKEN